MIQDEDVDGLSVDQLRVEVRKLREGIRRHRDSTGQELCWHHPALWGLLPDKQDRMPTVPEWPEFLRGCVRYRESLDRQLPNALRTNDEPRLSSATLLTLTPLFPAGADLGEALRFYRDELGFSVEWEGTGMAGIRRGRVELSLVVNTDRNWAENTSASIGVSGLDALYEKYKSSSARVGPLEMKSWGRREFHMIVPSGVCLQFYEIEDGDI
ncbi:MAG TPA: hypothetical protein VJZ25_08810 [Gemmatimonadaceae bacterium]|nr:hypothetical protein [Gemmatimonadaceae bacterium]